MFERLFKTRPLARPVGTVLMLAALALLAYNVLVIAYLAYAAHVRFWA